MSAIPNANIGAASAQLSSSVLEKNHTATITIHPSEKDWCRVSGICSVFYTDRRMSMKSGMPEIRGIIEQKTESKGEGSKSIDLGKEVYEDLAIPARMFSGGV